jgi:hypothetical protein
MLYCAGLDVSEYDTRNQRYRIRFSKDKITKRSAFAKGAISLAYWDF